MDILAGIGAATEGIKLVNELRKIDKEVDKAELKLRLVELADKLLDAKQALQDAHEREISQKSLIDVLEARLKQKGKLRDANGLLFEIDDQESSVGEPYCNQCSVKEDRLYRLIFGPYAGGSHKCANCNGIFGPRSDWSYGGVSTEYDPLNPFG